MKQMKRCCRGREHVNRHRRLRTYLLGTAAVNVWPTNEVSMPEPVASVIAGPPTEVISTTGMLLIAVHSRHAHIHQYRCKTADSGTGTHW